LVRQRPRHPRTCKRTAFNSATKNTPLKMKRTKMDIVYDMLHAIQEKGGQIIPTHLLYKSNLSHQRMKLYLEELKKKNLIIEGQHNEKLVYKLTDDGRKFIQNFKQLKEFTQAFGL
jgi:predicted transcriptional regulator